MSNCCTASIYGTAAIYGNELWKEIKVTADWENNATNVPLAAEC